MGTRSGRGPLAACAVGALLAAFTQVPAAHAGDSLSELAQEVAAARTAADKADEAAAEAKQAATAAQGSLESARSDVDSARSTLDQAQKARTLAATTANEATVVEGETAQSAAAARSDLVQVARSAYMVGSGNVELAAFVDFATNGPSALNGLASHTIAVDRIETSVVAKVDRTGAAAQDAALTAEGARDDFAGAVRAQEDARQALVDAKEDVIAAAKAESRAERAGQRAAAEAKAAAADFAAAQAAFREELDARGGSAGAIATTPSVSAGNQAQLVWDILIAEGFSPESAAGILGNLQQESNIDPTTIQNGGPGRGLAQWSAGGRFDNGPNSLLAFAGSRGLDPWDAVTQVRFMIFEMEAGWGGFDIESYKKMTDVLAATVYFHDEFEGSADSAGFVRAVRGGFAMHWYGTLV